MYVKPNFYKNFRLYFPFMIEYDEGHFYAKYYPEDSNYHDVQKAYEDLYGAFDFEETDPILKINNEDPLEYLTQYSNTYDYSSKSDNGRLNSELAGAFYNKRLDVYNLPATADQTMIILFTSGKSLTVRFTIMVG